MAGAGRAHAPVAELETEPVLHFARAFVRLGQGRLEEALAEFRAAERLQASLEREHALPMEVRGWIVLVQALMGDTGGGARRARHHGRRRARLGGDAPRRRGAPRWRTAARGRRWTCWRR